jgi:hypothetical protein
VAVARSTIALLGTSESTGVTIATTATGTGSEVDVLGDNASAGVLELYLVFTSTVTAGSVLVNVNKRRLTGEAYQVRASTFGGIAPINGTQKLYLGSVSASRFMQVDVTNNATGANMTNVAVLGELFKVS